MSVFASSEFNIETITAQHRFSMFGKRDPVKQMWWRCGFLATVLLVLAVQVRVLAEPAPFILFLVIIAGLLFWQLLLYFYWPKKLFNDNAAFIGTTNTYYFNEDSIKIVSQKGDYNAETELAYNKIIKVAESGEYFFIYPDKSKTFIVDKSRVRNGSVLQIREKFESVEKLKYIRCKY